MDCSSARLFIPFHRPGGHDLDGPEAVDLVAHLAQCAECNAVAMTQHRLDQHLGKAMRSVEVPRGLRQSILERLQAGPRRRLPRWLGPALPALGVAAALLLLVGGWYLFSHPPRQNLSVKEVFDHVNIDQYTQDEGNARLRQLGARAAAPGFVNYAFLTGSPSLAILPGTEDLKAPVKVPQFVFQQGGNRVVIFAISRRQFQLDREQDFGNAYAYQLDVVQPEGSDFAYLVFFNCNWNWLKRSGEVD